MGAVTTPLPQSADARRAELEERALVARVRAGDYRAFGALFEQYYGPLVAFAERMTGAPDLAEDIVQAVFVRVWERRGEWDLRSRLAVYLRGAVRNEVLKDLRHSSVRERLAPHVEGPVSHHGPAEAVRAAEIDAAVARGIGRLPKRCRAVYALRWYDQLTYSEIAQILGISIKTVEAHVAVAIKTLRRVLRPIV
jgi:RNA polymerase sigma-70 factor (ECF subfamily)